MIVPETILMNFSNFRCDGYALIRSWNNDIGVIEMDPFDVKDLSLGDYEKMTFEEFANHIKYQINDGGFGAQEVIGAKVFVSAVYEGLEHNIFVNPVPIDTSNYDGFVNVSRTLTDKEKRFLNDNYFGE